jgi:hypothetical protein
VFNLLENIFAALGLVAVILATTMVLLNIESRSDASGCYAVRYQR